MLGLEREGRRYIPIYNHQKPSPILNQVETMNRSSPLGGKMPLYKAWYSPMFTHHYPNKLAGGGCADWKMTVPIAK